MTTRNKIKKLIAEHIALDLIFAIIFALLVTCIYQTVYAGSTGASNSETYIKPINETTFIVFLLSFILIYFLLCFSYKFINKFIVFASKNDNFKMTKTHILVWAAIMFLAWLPYFLAYYPGGTFGDTIGSLRFCTNNIMTNLQPFAYSVLINIFLNISTMCCQDYMFALALMTIFQFLLMGASFLLFLFWLFKKQVRFCIICGIAIFITFFPLFPLFALSNGKDTIFAILFFIWFIFALEFLKCIRNNTVKKRVFVLYVVFGVLFTTFRNNGVFIILLTSIFFFIYLILHKRNKNFKLFLTVLIIPPILAAFVQYIFYPFIGVGIGSNKVESVGLMIQQIAYTVNNNGNISDEQYSAINSFIPLDVLYSNFMQCIVDPIKFSEQGVNLTKENFLDFIKLWFALLLQNPDMYLKEFLLNTLGFWNLLAADPEFYVNPLIYYWPPGNNEFNLHNIDLINEWFGIPLQDILLPKICISSAWFFWPFVLCIWYICRTFKKSEALAFSPQIATWATIMIATPIAFSLRYVSNNFFTIVFIFVVPILLYKEKIKVKSQMTV